MMPTANPPRPCMRVRAWSRFGPLCRSFFALMSPPATLQRASPRSPAHACPKVARSLSISDCGAVASVVGFLQNCADCADHPISESAVVIPRPAPEAHQRTPSPILSAFPWLRRRRRRDHYACDERGRLFCGQSRNTKTGPLTLRQSVCLSS